MQPRATAVRSAVEAFASHLSARQWNALPGALAPGATWFTNGAGAQSGLAPATEHLKLLPQLADNFDTYSFHLEDLMCSDERGVSDTSGTDVNNGKAMLLATATGDLPGIHYVNNITMALELNSEGRIVSVREYPDLAQVAWLLDQLSKASGGAASSSSASSPSSTSS